METERCTWTVYPEEGEPYLCGKKAEVQFTQKNRRKGPTEPELLVYPRCGIHFTRKARDYAGIMGYEIVELHQ
jgi:hypothetical protein